METKAKSPTVKEVAAAAGVSISTVSRVLNGIQDLYFYHRVREAAQFQMKFNELFELGDYPGLHALAGDISAAIGKAKKGSPGE